MATVFISGASRGLGKALAAAFRGGGDLVFSAMRTAREGGDVALNVRSIESCETAIHQAVSAAGPIDILINNAGVHLAGPVIGLDQDQFKETLDVNLLGVWRLTKAAVPHMRPGGTIAVISSLSGLVGLPDDGAYAASKFALEGLCQSLAAELASRRIRVLLFEPGRIATGFAGSTTGTDPYDAALIIASAVKASDTQFRTPVGKDAMALFDRLDIDRGHRTLAEVASVTGHSWHGHSIQQSGRIGG